MISFTNPHLYVKGTCNVLLSDINSGNIYYQSSKMRTGSITPSTNLNEIRAGLGNPIAAMIPTDSGVTVDFEAADFSLWAKNAQLGGELKYGAPTMKCQVITAEGPRLAIDTSIGTPVARLGEDSPVCYVQTTGERSLVLDGGTAYAYGADGFIEGFTAEEGVTYKVWYYAQNVSAQMSVIKSLIDPKVVRFEAQIAVYSNQGGSGRQGTRVGWLYITIPYLKLQGDASISGDQTNADVTKISGTAIAYDTSVVSMSCEDCELPALAYYVYAPDNESSNIKGVAVVGGSIQVDIDGYIQIPVRLVAGDGSLVIPSNMAAGFTYESSDESIATVSESGVLSGISLGDTEVTITYTDDSGEEYECVVNVVSRYSASSSVVGYGKVGYMLVGEDAA